MPNLNALNSIAWCNSSVSFYIVKRSLVNRSASYKTFHVNIDDSLKQKLRNILINRISAANAISEYDFNTADIDNDLLSIQTENTDFNLILNDLLAPDDQQTVDSYELLLGSWLYIARFDVAGESPLFSVRRTSDTWTAKKVFQITSMVFKDNMLIDIEEDKIFRIDNFIDFFSYAGLTFIANKKNFEAALNFREGMERNRDNIVEELTRLDYFENVQKISELVGNNMRRLRKLSQVKNSGYYADMDFLTRLRGINESDNWGIQYSDTGKIVISEDNIEIILRVLNNDRLTSKINAENFDVDVKKKI